MLPAWSLRGAAASDGEPPEGAGVYYITFTPQPYGIQPDYWDVELEVLSGGETVGSYTPAKVEPIWESIIMPRMAFDPEPDTIRFSCRYRTTGTEEYRAVSFSAPFTEGDDQPAEDADAFGHPFVFGTYSVREAVPRYLGLDGKVHKAYGAVPISLTQTTLTTGWYYTWTSSMYFYDRIKIQGDVNLILEDGTAANYMKGVDLPEGSTLTIWGTENGGGGLIADASGEKTNAGIGGHEDRGSGSLTVNGGSVTAKGGRYAAGIGGGEGGTQHGSVIINGGEVYAEGGFHGAGIGGGEYYHGGGDGGTVIVNSGKVEAKGGMWAAGIGGGNNGTNGDITINGGEVTAITSMFKDDELHETGAAIGAGEGKAQGGAITINDGKVTATALWGAGIGGSAYNNAGTITINGGIVTALSETGAGIGGGGNKIGSGGGGSGGTVTIHGGVVTAMSGAKGAGIGGGNDGRGGTVLITGGIVQAIGGYLDYSYIADRGIFTNQLNVQFMGTNVYSGLLSEAFNILGTAMMHFITSGTFGGAGIGGGDDADGGNVTITGGQVTCIAGMDSAAPIGRGDGGSSDGNLELGPGIIVVAGPDAENAAPVPKADRKSAARSYKYAALGVCIHPDGLEYIDQGSNHLLSNGCAYCDLAGGTEEAHAFDPETHTCVCGHREYSVRILSEKAVQAECADPLTGAPAAYVPAGEAFDLRILPDSEGAFRDASAVYPAGGGTAELTPESVTENSEAKIYHYSAMPDADVTITVGSLVETWADLQTAIDSFENGSVITLAHDLTAGDQDTALTIPAGKTLTIDLNGCVLDRGLKRSWDWEENGNVMTVYGSLTIADSAGGGRLTGGCNRSYTSAGGVDIYSGGSLSMTGGEISGNTVYDTYAGGVYVSMGAEFRVSGNVVIQNNTANGIESNVVLQNRDVLIDVTGPLGPGARIGVRNRAEPAEDDPVIITRGLNGNGTAEAFVSDQPDYTLLAGSDGEAVLHYIPHTVTFDANGGSGSMEPVRVGPNADFTLPACGFGAPDGLHFAGWWIRGSEQTVKAPGEPIAVTEDLILSAVWDSPHVHEGETFEPWSQRDALPTEAGCYYLLYDVEIGPQIRYYWEVNSNIRLCLNGRTIDLNGRSIHIGQGGSLSLFDHGGGAVTGCDKDGGSSSVYVGGGSTLNLYGGSIQGNRSGYGTGGVEVEGTFNMYGGSVTGNRSASTAGSCGGVYPADGGVFRVSGGAQIEGNTVSETPVNARLPENAVISIAGPLAPSARICVTTDAEPAAGSPVTLTEGLRGNGTASNFASDDDRYVIGLNGDGEAILALPAAITFSPGDKSTGGFMDPCTAAPGLPFILPACGYTSSPGWVFRGWRIEGAETPAEAGSEIIVAGDLTIAAVWAPVFGPADFILPAQTVTIEAEAFKGAEMTAAYVPDGCEFIGAEAFGNCGRLIQVRLPKDCVIDRSAFSGCGALTAVFAPAGGTTEAWAAEQGIFFAAEGVEAPGTVGTVEQGGTEHE